MLFSQERNHVTHNMRGNKMATKRISLTVNKENYERFQRVRLGAYLPANILSLQMDKILEMALAVCDSIGDRGELMTKEERAKIITDVISKGLKDLD